MWYPPFVSIHLFPLLLFRYVNGTFLSHYEILGDLGNMPRSMERVDYHAVLAMITIFAPLCMLTLPGEQASHSSSPTGAYFPAEHWR